MPDTLEGINKDIHDRWRQFGGTPNDLPEADDINNDLQRRKIIAFKNHHGRAFLGNVNLYHGDKAELVPYKEGLVRNFEFGFVVPVDDQQLVEMIRERDESPYPGSSKDYEKIKAITARIGELEGEMLFWT